VSRILTNRWLLATARMLLGAVFAYAGALKTLNPEGFADAIAAFQILPSPLINIFALGLPPFEVLVGLMLIFGIRPRLAVFGTLILSAVFIAALALALGRGLNVDCGCFGSGPASPGKTITALGRDFILLASGCWLYWAHARQPDRGNGV